MARGNAPTHTTATATLSLGMIAVPIAIYAATDDGLKVRRRQVTGPDAHEVGSKSYDKVTGDEVASTDIRKVFDTPNGAVELTDDEIVSVTAARPGVAEVVGFLPESVLTDGTYIPERLYQVRPRVERKGKPAINDAVDRAFALICSAMAEEKQVALIKLAMRGPARYGLLTPAGQMWTLMFEEQVRSDRELPTTQPAAAEIALARQLVSMNRLDAAPELTDDAGARVLEYATAKALGTAPMPAPVAAHEMADDLLAALTASIAAKQAPAAKAKRAKKVAA